jgi:hypothetical protein
MHEAFAKRVGARQRDTGARIGLRDIMRNEGRAQRLHDRCGRESFLCALLGAFLPHLQVSRKDLARTRESFEFAGCLVGLA